MASIQYPNFGFYWASTEMVTSLPTPRKPTAKERQEIAENKRINEDLFRAMRRAVMRKFVK